MVRNDGTIRCLRAALRVRYRAAFYAALILFGGMSACTDDPLTPAPSDVPFLYLLIAPTPLPRAGEAPADSTIYALLLTTGTPLQTSPRTAEQFRMTRTRDGAAFAWSASTIDSLFANYRVASFFNGGNYALAERGSAQGAGRSDLRALDTLVLRVTTQGRELQGTTVIPARPALALAREGAQWVVRWPRAAGAAAYHITGYLTGFPEITTDTFYVLFPRDGIPGTPQPELRVTALDTNVYRYLVDSSRVRAGIQGGYGLFGAFNGTSIRLDPALAVGS